MADTVEEVKDTSQEAGKIALEDEREFGEDGGPAVQDVSKLEGEVQSEKKDEGHVQTEDEKKAEADALAKKEEEKKEEVKIEDPRDLELRELRRVSREQKRDLDKLNEKIAGTTKVLEEANLITEEDKEKAKAEEIAFNIRTQELEQYQELMRLNPKYEDVDTVCSQEHLDELVELMANALVKADPASGTLDEVRKNLESEIWSQRNPYTLMYDQIKKYHPAYAKPISKEEPSGEKKEEVKDPVKDKLAEEKKGEEKKDTATGPGSIHNIPGGDSQLNGGWTTDRIDGLDELELSKVPTEIYQRYLKNELK
jgi:hypothetical protein